MEIKFEINVRIKTTFNHRSDEVTLDESIKRVFETNVPFIDLGSREGAQ